MNGLLIAKYSSDILSGQTVHVREQLNVLWNRKDMSLKLDQALLYIFDLQCGRICARIY